MPKLSVLSPSPAEIYYEDRGDGDPIVLIHGWPLSGRSWEAQVQTFVDAGHRVVTYDRRGFGWSSQATGGYDYDTFADDLDAVMRHLDLTNATLVGFSMGGGEVARYLSRHGSDRVSRVVFAAAVPPYLLQTDDNPEGALPDEAVQGMVAECTKDRLAFLDGFFGEFFGTKGTLGTTSLKVSDAQVHYAKQIAAMASPLGTAKCIDAFARTDFRTDLEAIDLPALVIHGDGDLTVPLEASGTRTAAMVKDAQLVVLEGAPHGCNVSHADEFNEAVLSFVKAGVPGSVPAG